MAIITKFGKIIRIHRIDRDENMSCMASALGISTSFLSSIERGRKKISDDLIDKISRYFNLSYDEHEDLVISARLSQPQVKINLTTMTIPERDRVFAFLDTLNT